MIHFHSSWGAGPSRPALFLLLFVLVLVGCRTGVNIALKDSSGINVGSISIEDSTWPIVSYFTGPTFNFWTREGLDQPVFLDATATMTNSTSALAIYQSTEDKAIAIRMGYGFTTNSVGLVASPPPLKEPL